MRNKERIQIKLNKVRTKFSFHCAVTNGTPIKLGDVRPIVYTHNICVRGSECLAANLGRFIPGGKR